MWLERFLIIVPSLANKHLPYSWGSYRPQPVEIMIMTATFAAMALLYVLFSKFVPIISVWELRDTAHVEEDDEASRRERATLMPWMAVAGGLAGMTIGYFLTTVTSRAWPIETGGMPIVAMWPILIVIFEMTMLGAILATVITLLVSAGLPSRRRPTERSFKSHKTVDLRESGA